jgi:ferredoxin
MKQPGCEADGKITAAADPGRALEGPMMAANNLQVTIDPERCVHFGKCASVAPGIFMLDEETAKAFYDEERLPTADPKMIFAAARACPTQAIQVHQFGRRVYPQILTPMVGVGGIDSEESGDGE